MQQCQILLYPVISRQPARSTFISSSVIKTGKDIRSKDIKTLAVSMQIMYYELVPKDIADIRRLT